MTLLDTALAVAELGDIIAETNESGSVPPRDLHR
jgi:hypothetical protein